MLMNLEQWAKAEDIFVGITNSQKKVFWPLAFNKKYEKSHIIKIITWYVLP